MQRLRGVLRSPSLSTPARVALTGGGGCPALSPLPPPPPSLGRLWCKQLSLDSQAAGPGRRPAPYGSCGLRAKRLGWEGRFPQPVYRDPRPLSPVPICCLPLSPWGQPLVPSSGLPPLTSCQWPSVTGIRMLNSASACVCVCVCALRPHPRACTWRGASEPGVPQKQPLPPASLPSVLPMHRGVANRHLQKAREGAVLGASLESPPWTDQGRTNVCSSAIPGLLLHGDPGPSMVRAPDTAPGLHASPGKGCWGESICVSPFVSHSAGITVGQGQPGHPGHSKGRGHLGPLP